MRLLTLVTSLNRYLDFVNLEWTLPHFNAKTSTRRTAIFEHARHVCLSMLYYASASRNPALHGRLYSLMNTHIVIVQLLNPALLFVTPIACSTSDFPVLHNLSEFAQTHVHWISDAIHLIFYCPFSSPQSFPASGRVFSSELAIHIRWPKYWSFSISLSSEYSGLISFRIDWFDLLAVKGTLRSSPAPQFRKINSSVLSFLYGLTLGSVQDYGKNHSLYYTKLRGKSVVSAF